MGLTQPQGSNFPIEAKHNIVSRSAQFQHRYKLAKNRFGVRDSTVLADFVEADFPGYFPWDWSNIFDVEQYLISPSSPFVVPPAIQNWLALADPNGFSGVVSFGGNTGGTPQTVYAIYAIAAPPFGSGQLVWAANVWDRHLGFTDMVDGYTFQPGGPAINFRLGFGILGSPPDFF